MSALTVCRCGESPANWGLEQRRRVRARELDGEFRTEQVWIAILEGADRGKFCRSCAEDEARRRNK